MRHQSPALGCLEVDVGGDYKGLRWAGAAHDVDPLDDAVKADAECLYAPNVFNVRAYRAVRKHRLKTTPNRQRTDLSRTAWVDADDIVFVGPAGHELVDVAEPHGFIKCGFGFVCMAVVGQGWFGCSHG